MSMQRIVNYGSFLQAYGLKQTIENLGHEVVFVDYHIGSPVALSQTAPQAQSVSSAKKVLNMLNPSYRKKRKANIENYNIFSEFENKFINEYLPMLNIKKDEFSYQTACDVLVIGSDEVFNCTQSNSLVGFSPELFGEDNNAKRVISYGASFGSTTIEKLEKCNKVEEVKKYLKNNFSAISVRDTNSLKIVSQFTGEIPYLNLDPVLVSDYSSFLNKKIDIDNYILVYDYCDRISDAEAEKITAFAKKVGKTTVSVGCPQKFCDKRLIADPFTLLSYVKNADFVVTDTFHGSVFSTKLNVPFATIVRDSNKEKLTSLLNGLGLDNQIIDNLDNLEKLYNTKVDFSTPNSIIAVERQKTMDYLSSNLVAD